MSDGARHPFTNALYEKTEDGNVLVTDGDARGLFRPDGKWIEGELFECDPQMCNWVSGPRHISHRLQPVDTMKDH